MNVIEVASPAELQALLAEDEGKKPRNKYRALRCNQPNKAGECWPECGKHDSHGEHMRAMELQRMERAGLIRNLKEKPRFVLCQDGCQAKHRHLVYEADWSYEEIIDCDWPECRRKGPQGLRCVKRGDGCDRKGVIEDYKSPATRTAVYRLKRHLMESRGYTIRETGAK